MPRYSVPVIVRPVPSATIEVVAADPAAARRQVRNMIAGLTTGANENAALDEAIGRIEESLVGYPVQREDLEVPDGAEWDVEEVDGD